MKSEIIKEEVSNFSMLYSKKHAKRNKEKYTHVIKYIERLKEDMLHTVDESKLDEIHNMTQKYENIIKQYEANKAKGAIVRSRAKWYTDSEKNTKYFLGLECNNYSNKTMKCLIKDNGEICCDTKKILLEQRKFYAKLYEKDVNARFLYCNSSGKVITPEDRVKLDSKISYNEFSEALKSLSNNKTPGVSGLPPEFYKMFWKRIGNYVYQAMMYSIEKGMLPYSA